MERKQAAVLIQELFTQSFDRQNYQRFLNELLNRVEPRDSHYSGNMIPHAFADHINQYWRIGKYIDPDGDELDLLIVEVKHLTKLERARSALRNFAVSRLKQFEKDASLIAFYAKDDRGDDWRFSFVKIEHEAYQDEKGKVKLKQELTPAKRYSYLVGVHENSYTACNQLLPLLEAVHVDPRIDEIEQAFSIEKVTKEFFEQYKSLFQKLAEYLKHQKHFQQSTEEETNQAVSRFAKKLLGQIVFLYFLQKKGWLGVPKGKGWGDGPRRFMREKFEQVAISDGNYYRDFLCYLFYEALANERKGQKDSGYYKRFNCRVPFLNGGLFEADYDWQNVVIDLPNILFHNEDNTKSGDHGNGILDVFDRYNFTIKEDEPLDKEVAVDPEMLGKVFENMLEVTERKSKGAFYTPREIVHYMCQESLIHYLDNSLNDYTVYYCDLGSNQLELLGDIQEKGQLKFVEECQNIRVSREDLDTLIRKGHLALENDTQVLGQGRETKTYKFQLPQAVRKYAKDLDNALKEIKACDPAIGSGAFPVGLLNEIVNARLALSPHSGNAKTVYDLKRHAIAECIYGVDIDPSAIDIARLRLWLSLIVDETDYDTIEALPNLDYKIVCGDSLIGFPEDIWNVKIPAFARIEELKKDFFKETDHEKKIKLKDQIDNEIKDRLASTKLGGGKKITHWQVDFDFRLFFSEVWHDKGGFDIVIGNPPYVQIQKFSGQEIQKAWGKQGYETFAKTGDIYCLFYEKGHRLLRERGALAFITSNKWMRAAYGKKLREFFSEETQPLTLIDFSSFQVFSTATVDTNVLIFRKQKRTSGVKACLIDPTFTRTTSLDAIIAQKSLEIDDLSGESWVISSRAEYDIKKQIEKIGTPLREWELSIYRGVLTGLNEAFIIDGKKKDELIKKDPKSARIIKPVLRGCDIKRYRIDFADLWLINTHNGYKKIPHIDIKQYPVVKAHLDQFLPKLKKRQDKGKTPYNLRNCAYLKDFEKGKIVWGNMALSCQFAIADQGVYINAPSPLIGGGDRYLLAVLNSSVADFYIRSLGVTRSGGYFEYKPMFVEKLPVPQIKSEGRKPFEALANYVLFATKNEQKLQSAFFEQLIDGLVYELYFPDEIKAASKEILLHLGELTPITDDMSQKKKLAVIQQEFNRLYDPGHPVRNHIETLDSVPVVQTIREGLKR